MNAKRKSPEVLERYVIRLILIVYVVFQVNAAFHHGSWGQDFNSHQLWISQALANPWKFTTITDPGRPEPPLYHLLASLVFKITGGIHYLEVIALLSAAINTLGLIIFYKLLRLMLNDRSIRIACFLFFAFLPVFMIHSLVLATDALCVPIAVVMYYFLVKVGREQDPRRIVKCLAWMSGALLAGVATKFLFASQGIALLIALAIYVWTNRLHRAQIAKGFIAIAFITLIALALVLRAHASIQFNATAGTEMAPSDILLLHRHDTHVLTAPPYGQPADPRDGTPVRFPYELLRQHRYSYAALVHLAIFTDVLNIYQYDPADNVFGARSRSNQREMALAVKTGLLFSLPGLILTALMIVKSFYGSMVQRKGEYAEWAALAICGLGWFLNVVVFLPTVQAYIAGYWTPRLIIPALLCFTVLCAIAVERFIADRSRAWAKAILVVVVFQSLLHLSFLWPWGLLRGQTPEGYPRLSEPTTFAAKQ